MKNRELEAYGIAARAVVALGYGVIPEKIKLDRAKTAPAFVGQVRLLQEDRGFDVTLDLAVAGMITLSTGIQKRTRELRKSLNGGVFDFLGIGASEREVFWGYGCEVDLLVARRSSTVSDWLSSEDIRPIVRNLARLLLAQGAVTKTDFETVFKEGASKAAAHPLIPSWPQPEQEI